MNTFLLRVGLLLLNDNSSLRGLRYNNDPVLTLPRTIRAKVLNGDASAQKIGRLKRRKDKKSSQLQYFFLSYEQDKLKTSNSETRKWRKSALIKTVSHPSCEYSKNKYFTSLWWFKCPLLSSFRTTLTLGWATLSLINLITPTRYVFLRSQPG